MKRDKWIGIISVCLGAIAYGIAEKYHIYWIVIFISGFVMCLIVFPYMVLPGITVLQGQEISTTSKTRFFMALKGCSFYVLIFLSNALVAYNGWLWLFCAYIILVMIAPLVLTPIFQNNAKITLAEILIIIGMLEWIFKEIAGFMSFRFWVYWGISSGFVVLLARLINVVVYDWKLAILPENPEKHNATHDEKILLRSAGLMALIILKIFTTDISTENPPEADLSDDDMEMTSENEKIITPTPLPSSVKPTPSSECPLDVSNVLRSLQYTSDSWGMYERIQQAKAGVIPKLQDERCRDEKRHVCGQLELIWNAYITISSAERGTYTGFTVNACKSVCSLSGQGAACEYECDEQERARVRQLEAEKRGKIDEKKEFMNSECR